MNFVDQVQQRFNASLKHAEGGEKQFREHAWAEYLRLGLPARENEAWKYSTLAGLNRVPWLPVEKSEDIPVAAREMMVQWKGEFDIAVMVNGQLLMKDSQLTLESGYALSQRSLQAELPLVYDDGFLSAAAAVHHGGYELRVADGIQFPRPLLILHCQHGETSWSSTLNRVILGRGSRFQLVEVFMGTSMDYLRTDVTQVEISESAELAWVRSQEETGKAFYFGEVQAQLAASSKLTLTQLNAGAGWARSSLKVNLGGEQAEAHINGLSLGRDQQHVDQRVQMNHLAPLTQSSQLFKGILKDRARGVLNGKIYIARHAQKVISSQLNHNLLLSSQAEADTKPELEIYADDVKANHGATIGRLDDDKLFYLLSRAIPRGEAEQMLAQAFVGDVLMKILSPPLRELLQDRVERLLPDYSSQMSDAKGQS